MIRQADTWLTDQICLTDQTDSIDVDPTTGQPSVTINDENTYPALIQEQTNTRQQNDGRTLGLADRIVYLPVDAMPETGTRVIILRAQDPTIINRAGTITDVERDSLRARRRCTVRFDSNT